MIRDVVSFAAKLKIESLRQIELLAQRKIELSKGRACQRVTAGVTERTRSRNGERSRIYICQAVVIEDGIDTRHDVGPPNVSTVSAAGDIDDRPRHGRAVHQKLVLIHGSITLIHVDHIGTLNQHVDWYPGSCIQDAA